MILLLTLLFCSGSIHTLSAHTDTISKTRLSPAINDHRSTFLPVLAGDSLLFATRKYHRGNRGGEADPDDIWQAAWRNGTWGGFRNSGSPLNTPETDVLFSVLPDRRTALVGGVYSSVFSRKQPGFSLSFRYKDEWSTPEGIFIRNYKSLNPGYFGSLASDGRTLLLAAEREDGKGDLDLYVCFYVDTLGDWSAPLHLGDLINSTAAEATPYLAGDGRTLYFSSERAGGSGGADLYMSRRLDDSWQQWTPPVPLIGINSAGEDSGLTLAENGIEGYCISTDPEEPARGIYHFTLPQQLQPSPFLIAEGSIPLHRSDTLAKQLRCSFLSPTGKLLSRAFPYSDGNSLSVRTFIPALPIVYAAVSGVGIEPVIVQFSPPEIGNAKAVSRLLNFAFERPEATELPSTRFIFFNVGDTTVSSQYIGDILLAAEALLADTTLHLTISGHTDDVGDDLKNEALSALRAEAVYHILERAAVPFSRVNYRYAGETEPLISDVSREARQKNRRVELRFYRP